MSVGLLYQNNLFVYRDVSQNMSLNFSRVPQKTSNVRVYHVKRENLIDYDEDRRIFRGENFNFFSYIAEFAINNGPDYAETTKKI